jgi:hypothetical protein
VATITLNDMSAAVNWMQDPNGLYVLDCNITTNASQDIVNVRVNGSMVWQGLPAEATGG